MLALDNLIVSAKGFKVNILQFLGCPPRKSQGKSIVASLWFQNPTHIFGCTNPLVNLVGPGKNHPGLNWRIKVWMQCDAVLCCVK